ncbi:hypothetical protein HK097_005841, partial [Rhizophlyctis rosea]
ARGLEGQGLHSRAVDVYLGLDTSVTDDEDFLEEMWERAVEVTMKFVPERGTEVVRTVCERLVGIKRYTAAGELYAGVGMYKEAIDSFVKAGEWDKAREVLGVAPKLKGYVEGLWVGNLKSSGRAEELVEVDAGAGLEALCAKREWETCLEKAAAQSPETLNKYLLRHSVTKIQDHDFGSAVSMILKYDVPTQPQNHDVYLRLAREILKSGKESPETVTSLREVLFKLSSIPAFQTYLQITHLQTLRTYCLKKRDLAHFSGRQSIAMLRYIRDVPVDKAFYEAGLYAKENGMGGPGFVCWNRFLDVCEVFEDEGPTATLSNLDNTDFEGSDVPFDVEVGELTVDDETREKVRDTVLQISLDTHQPQELDHRDCEECGESIYDASLVCGRCQAKCEACVVTGYPVLKNKVRCGSCSKFANKEDWNKFVMIER